MKPRWKSVDYEKFLLFFLYLLDKDRTKIGQKLIELQCIGAHSANVKEKVHKPPIFLYPDRTLVVARVKKQIMQNNKKITWYINYISKYFTLELPILADIRKTRLL